MRKLSEEVRLLSEEESQMLIADKLPKSKRIKSGLYLVCRTANSYTALDYGDRQNWQECFGEDTGSSPEGWVKDFKSPLRAIDWLYETRR